MTNEYVLHQNEKLLRQQKALANFGTFSFHQTELQPILEEAARVCAECLGVSYSKICRFQPSQDNLLVVAGHGWRPGVVGFAISVANETSPQGRAFITSKPQLCRNIGEANTYNLPLFYLDHHVLSTVDVIVAAKHGPPFGVLEVDSQTNDAFGEHDIDFLTGFANILAEAVVAAARSEDLRRTIDRMDKLIEEKEILSQELKHRVRNNLHLVYGLLTTELDSAHSEVSMTAFRSIALRVMGLAQVFDHLLGVGMTSVIRFDEYISALCENLPELYGQDTVKLECFVEPVLINLDEATALGVVITELVNNAYIHAFPGGVGKISVTLELITGLVFLSIADDGVGFVEIETTRRGMSLVKRLVQQVGAELSLTADRGSKWTIVFPYNPVSVKAVAAWNS
jgi:two-component sensor histidine kinase